MAHARYFRGMYKKMVIIPYRILNKNTGIKIYKVQIRVNLKVSEPEYTSMSKRLGDQANQTNTISWVKIQIVVQARAKTNNQNIYIVWREIKKCNSYQHKTLFQICQNLNMYLCLHKDNISSLRISQTFKIFNKCNFYRISNNRGFCLKNNHHLLNRYLLIRFCSSRLRKDKSEAVRNW